MPRSHKQSSRGKAKYQTRLKQANETRKARLRRQADDARRREQLAVERDARQRERFERNANYIGRPADDAQ